MDSYYLVFAGRKWKNVMGEQGISWDIAGVWQARSEEQACLIAAQKLGVGTCFAVEGFAWGVDTVDAGEATELGIKADPITRLERMGMRLAEQLSQALPAAKQQTLEEGDNSGDSSD